MRFDVCGALLYSDTSCAFFHAQGRRVLQWQLAAWATMAATPGRAARNNDSRPFVRCSLSDGPKPHSSSPPAESQPHRPRTHKSPFDSPTAASPIPPPADSVLSPGAPLAFATPVPSPPRFPLLDPLSSSSPPADHLSSRTVPGQFGTTQCACMFRVSPPHPIPHSISRPPCCPPTQRWAYGLLSVRACNRAT